MNLTPRYNKPVTLLVMLFLAVASNASAKDQMAIRGQFTGQSTITPLSATEWVFQQENISTGNISHLGRVTAEWVVREVRIDPSYAQLIVAQPNWIGTITAANGDQLFGTYTFHSTIMPISVSGDVSFVADLNITGGTGRFKGMRGQAEARGQGNIFTRKFTIEMTGVVSKRK
jgi:hypothetical protein